MDDSEPPDPKNPLSPYYPSEVPSMPGNGRKWFAISMALLLLLGTAYAAISVFAPL